MQEPDPAERRIPALTLDLDDTVEADGGHVDARTRYVHTYPRTIRHTHPTPTNKVTHTSSRVHRISRRVERLRAHDPAHPPGALAAASAHALLRRVGR